jgi:hypothetical protein
MKRFLRIVLILLALLVIAGFVAFLALDSIVASGIRHGGTYALGVNTSVDGVDVHLGSEIRASFSGLSVENPEGFEAKHFLRLEDGNMRFPANVALAHVVTVPELKLSGIAVDLERRDGKTNYGVLLDNLERLSAGGQPKEKEEGLGKRFQIDRIVLSDIAATIDLLPLPGVAADTTRVSVKIPSIEIENVGSDMSTAEIFSLVVRTLLTAVLQNAGSLLPADMLKDLQGRLGALGDVVFDLPGGAAKASQEILGVGAKVLEGSVQEAGKDLGKVEEQADEMLKDVGGLLKKKKD